MENFPILSLITFLPVLGMLIIMFLPKTQTQVNKKFNTFNHQCAAGSCSLDTGEL